MNGNSNNTPMAITTTKSRSIDFSNLLSPPQTQKSIPNHREFKPQETQQIHKDMINISKKRDTHDSFADQGDEDGVGERFGVILSRNRSVSSSATSSNGFSAREQNSKLESAVKRAFSMRRSSSVSNGYCRIYHQSHPIGDDDDDARLKTPQSRSKKKKGDMILKACCRLFKF